MSPRVRRVALTGGIATGKSYCLARFAALGVPTIDADRLARQAVEPGTPELTTIVKRFGTGILTSDGRLDRAALGRIVFADSAARLDLEAVIHPAVYEAIAKWFSKLAGRAPFAIADIPLLFETEREGDFDSVIVTSCRPEQQMERLIARGLTDVEARQRIAAQMPIDEKARRASHVIDTSGTIAGTDRQVEEMVRTLSGQPPR